MSLEADDYFVDKGKEAWRRILYPKATEDELLMLFCYFLFFLLPHFWLIHLSHSSSPFTFAFISLPLSPSLTSPFIVLSCNYHVDHLRGEDEGLCEDSEEQVPIKAVL